MKIRLGTFLSILLTVGIYGVISSIADAEKSMAIGFLIFTAIIGIICAFVYGSLGVFVRDISVCLGILIVIYIGFITNGIFIYIILCGLPFSIALFKKKYVLGGVCGGICLFAEVFELLLLGNEFHIFFPITLLITTVITTIITIASKKKN